MKFPLSLEIHKSWFHICDRISSQALCSKGIFYTMNETDWYHRLNMVYSWAQVTSSHINTPRHRAGSARVEGKSRKHRVAQDTRVPDNLKREEGKPAITSCCGQVSSIE